MSAFVYRPDPLDELPPRAAAQLPGMEMLPTLARRIQVSRRGGQPLDARLAFDIDKLMEGLEAALDLSEAGHESEAFNRSLDHLRHLARSIGERVEARLAGVAADLEIQSAVAVQDLAEPQDATTAWRRAVAVPAGPAVMGGAVPPVVLRTGFDDEDCGRVSGGFHLIERQPGSPVAPSGSVVVPANCYVRFEPGDVFRLHVNGWQAGEQADYPPREESEILRLLTGEEGAVVHGPAVIEAETGDGKPLLEMKKLGQEAKGLCSGWSVSMVEILAVSAAVFGAVLGISFPPSVPPGMPGGDDLQRSFIFLGGFFGMMTGFIVTKLSAVPISIMLGNNLYLGLRTSQARAMARTLNRKMKEAACRAGLQMPGENRYRLRMGRLAALPSRDLEDFDVTALAGVNFIPIARAQAVPGATGLRVLEPLKALPAPDMVTEDTKVVRLEPARR